RRAIGAGLPGLAEIAAAIPAIRGGTVARADSVVFIKVAHAVAAEVTILGAAVPVFVPHSQPISACTLARFPTKILGRGLGIRLLLDVNIVVSTSDDEPAQKGQNASRHPHAPSSV